MSEERMEQAAAGRHAPEALAPDRGPGNSIFFILQIFAGSFSAVSKRNFARKYAFDSIFQALQDMHIFAPLQDSSKKPNWKSAI